MKTRQGSKRHRDDDEFPATSNLPTSNGRGPKDLKKGMSKRDAQQDTQPTTTDRLESKSTKKSRREQPSKQLANSTENNGGPTSEDDAPEEMSLSAAKAQAEDVASHEQAEQKSARLSTRTKRKQSIQSGGETNFQPIDEPELAEEAAGTEQDAVKGTVSEENADVLPQEVIKALQKQRRAQQASSRITESPVSSEDVQPVTSDEERIQEREVGPVTVAVLDSKPTFGPSVAARDYARQRLYGSRHKRSQEMLCPVPGKKASLQWSHRLRKTLKAG